jgi:hypothetical protein
MHSVCILSPSDNDLFLYSMKYKVRCNYYLIYSGKEFQMLSYIRESGVIVPDIRISFSESSLPSIQTFGLLPCQRIGQTYSGHQWSWAVHFSNSLLSCSEISCCCTKRVCHCSLCPSPKSSAQCSPLDRILRLNNY